MREVWLRPNRRALAFGLVLPLLGTILGAALVGAAWSLGDWRWLQWIGWPLIALAGATTGVLVHWLRTPRLAYEGGFLLVYLRSARPFCVPIEEVECFLLGQVPSLTPGSGDRPAQSSAVLVRVADSATQWHERNVKPALGKWTAGYITIRGTWCEPLGESLLQRLNRRLVEVRGGSSDHGQKESS
jgi:MFS family permease